MGIIIILYGSPPSILCFKKEKPYECTYTEAATQNSGDPSTDFIIDAKSPMCVPNKMQ